MHDPGEDLADDDETPQEVAGSVEPGPELAEALREAIEAHDGPDAKEASAEAKLAELQDVYVRLQAEFENFRRRGLKERGRASNLVLRISSRICCLRSIIWREPSNTRKGAATAIRKGSCRA